jgi:hypothetical protein
MQPQMKLLIGYQTLINLLYVVKESTKDINNKWMSSHSIYEYSNNCRVSIAIFVHNNLFFISCLWCTGRVSLGLVDKILVKV